MERPRPRSAAQPAVGLVLVTPFLRRIAWYTDRVRGSLDRRFFLSLGFGILGFVAVSALLIMLVEKAWTLEAFFDPFDWWVATVFSQGDQSYVVSPGGRVVSWVLVLFGVGPLDRRGQRTPAGRAPGDAGGRQPGGHLVRQPGGGLPGGAR